MNPMRRLQQSVLVALYGVVAALPIVGTGVFAQTPAADKKADTQALETMQVVGSRRANASATDTPVPVDFIPLAKITEQGGQFDLAQTLQ